MRQHLLERKIESCDDSVGADDCAISGVEHHSAAAFVLVIGQEVVLQYDQSAVVLFSACLVLHERVILLLDIICHFLDVSYVFFSTFNLQSWFQQLDHSLQDNLLDGAKVSWSVFCHLLLQSLLHELASFDQAIVALLHLSQSRRVDFLGSFDVKVLIKLIYFFILFLLKLLSSFENDLSFLFLKCTLSKDLDFKCFLMRILSEHSFHLKATHVKMDIR